LDQYTEFDELKQSIFAAKTRVTETKEAHGHMKTPIPEVASLPFKE
jgi:hypothetical protein